MASTFWLSDICSLTNSMNINPFVSGDRNFKYNSLTRLIILVTIISLFIPNQNKIIIFTAGLISLYLTYIIYMITHSSEKMSNELNEATTAEATTTPVEQPLDHDINKANLVTLDYTPPNTDLKEGQLFLKPNEMPASITATPSAVSNIETMHKSVPTSNVKQLQSLLDRNLSFQ